MRVLQINKYLHPKGGSETVCFQHAQGLAAHGAQVDFWGMHHPANVFPGQEDELAPYVEFKDLHGLGKLRAGLATIYSTQARRRLETFLDRRAPYDIAHLHNFNFQLTPSILGPLKKRGVKVVYTAHDSQLACPFHRLFNFQENRVCTRCVQGSFVNCLTHRCVEDSAVRSALAMAESMLHHGLGTYDRSLDLIIAPSRFMADILGRRVRTRIEVLPNCVDIAPRPDTPKEDFVLYFGRVSQEKGILELSRLFRDRNLPLVIVGDGPDVGGLALGGSVRHLGRKGGEELRDIVRRARFVIQPSKWYENCPMTVIESLACGTPVIAPDHSGFRELVDHGRTGFLLDFADLGAMGEAIENALRAHTPQMSADCLAAYRARFSPQPHFDTLNALYKGLL